ncbi:MAG: ISL3 family transposase [Terracidiphilus sp.]
MHSRYRRKLADLPLEGIPVQIELHVRRFFCGTPGCGQRIFTERLPGTVSRYARRTSRLGQALSQIGLALGGAACARLTEQLGILSSGSTVLRYLRRKPVATQNRSPRVLGMDDWAWRKGHPYGTILCDLEAGKVVDLLPDREAETVTQWFSAHPGTEIVSCDRASAYAEAARKAAPQAVQVADRRHLLRNLSEALKNALAPHHRILTRAATTVDATKTPEPSAVPAAPTPTKPILKQQLNRDRRQSRYEQVMELARIGMTKRRIARQLSLDRRTVRRWMRLDGFPERKPAHRSSSVDIFADYLDQRWQQGCHNGTQLWREMQTQGFRGKHSIVRHWLAKRHVPRYGQSEQVPKPQPKQTSPRQVVWLMLTEPDSERRYLEEIYRESPLIAATARVAREFVRIIGNRDRSAWNNWLDAAQTTALASFATHLVRDQDAMVAALNLPWSNGQVEGQVHRLKLIKRSMYGRAKFDLLRIRVINSA